jgi:HKD family nuclease
VLPLAVCRSNASPLKQLLHTAFTLDQRQADHSELLVRQQFGVCPQNYRITRIIFLLGLTWRGKLGIAPYVSSMITRQSMLGAIFSILLLYRSADAQLVFPHFAQGGGYQTTFTLTNLSDTATTATVQVFLESGAIVTTLVVPLPPNGTAKAALSGTSLTVGWVLAAVSPPVDFTGSETIQLAYRSGDYKGPVVVAEASVLPASLNRTVRFPVTERDGIATGVAVANPDAVAATLTLSLRDQSGAMIGTEVVSLGPAQHLARFIMELFQGIGSFDGSLEVSSTSVIAVLALRQSSSGVFSTLPTASPATSTLESFFSPNGGVAARIVQEIQRARASIDIAIYTFTQNEIADALISAKNRGVAIRIIADSEQATAVGSAIARMEAAGFQVRRTAGIGGGIMHNKFAIFDSYALLTGSYNWSSTAETRNFENAVFIHDAATIDAYQANFTRIWNKR